MPNSHTISAVIICFNEEANIENCLKSLVEVCDEIVVVDSFSTDRTLEICERYNAIVFQREWEGYSKAKNYGNSKAKSDYILSLDADEVLSDDLIASINHLKTQGLKTNYSLRRITNYCGKWIKHAGWYPDIKFRLFPKGEAEWQGKHVHESLISKNSLKNIVLDGHLLHYSYKTIAEHESKDRKYAELAARRDINKNHSLLRAYLSAGFQFVKMYILKLGFVDGKLGLQLCHISAKSKIYKYNCWKKLQN